MSLRTVEPPQTPVVIPVALGNVLLNPGFETGDFTGWTPYINDANGSVSVTNGYSNTGKFSCVGWAIGATYAYITSATLPNIPTSSISSAVFYGMGTTPAYGPYVEVTLFFSDHANVVWDVDVTANGFAMIWHREDMVGQGMFPASSHLTGIRFGFTAWGPTYSAYQWIDDISINVQAGGPSSIYFYPPQ